MATWTDIGAMDTLVTIQRAILNTGARGQKDFTFEDFARVYAGINANTDEAINNENLEQGENITLTIYKIPQLTTRWRVLIMGKPYEIISINPISRTSPVCELGLSAIDR